MIPVLPGLYQVRRVEFDGLDYIGQTGMILKNRLAMLKGVYSSEMPYRAPHTAGPALWALRRRDECEFEVSVVPVVGNEQWRQGLECLAISLYRQKYKKSPTANFGRMPTGYRISSSNDTQLAISGKRFKGGLTTEIDANHLPGIAPLGTLSGSPVATNWCGHYWSDWVSILDVRLLPDESCGLYRIRTAGKSSLIYIGEGKVRDRLLAHFKKTRQLDKQQHLIFAAAQPLECSWVLSSAWSKNQRQELENDLIAAHLFETGRVPPAQFLGG